MNPLEELKRTKAAERRQLSSGEPPTLAQFWAQPHGVRLLLINGNQLAKIPSVVVDRGEPPSRQTTGTLTAFPAHVGTLLSRRRRGRWTVVKAMWFSSGWTKVQETTGGTISTDSTQIGVIASSLAAITVGISYSRFNGDVGLIEANADGAIIRETHLTPVLVQPIGDKWHPAIVADPGPMGLSSVLHEMGIDVGEHVCHKCEMRTIFSDYGL